MKSTIQALKTIRHPRGTLHLSSPARTRHHPRAAPTRATAALARPLTTTRALRAGNDDDKKQNMLNRDAMNTESNEYSKSGSDAASAGEEDAAFNPDKTSPETEKQTAGVDGKEDRNPLQVSPANHEVSKPRGEMEGGAESGPDRTASSGGGSPNKGKKVS